MEDEWMTEWMNVALCTITDRLGVNAPCVSYWLWTDCLPSPYQTSWWLSESRAYKQAHVLVSSLTVDTVIKRERLKIHPVDSRLHVSQTADSRLGFGSSFPQVASKELLCCCALQTLQASALYMSVSSLSLTYICAQTILLSTSYIGRTEAPARFFKTCLFWKTKYTQFKYRYLINVLVQ